MPGSSDTAKLVAELSLKDKLSAGVNTALKSVGRLEKGLGRSAKGVGQLGLGLGKVVAVGAGVAAVALGGATKAAIDFEDAFAGVKKTVDETELKTAGLSFDALKKQFIDLSTQIPITASDLARIGETAGALGIRAQDITKFADTVAKLGVTTNLTTDEAANSLGKIGTILNLTGKQFEDFGDILVNLGNKGASTEAEIIEVTKRFAAAGKSAGLSTPQILAFASAISSAGVEPEAAGGALSRLFGKLVQETALGTTAAKNFAKTSGKSFKDWSKLVKKDTTGAMLAFLKSLKGLSKFDQAIALEKVGITNTRDINAIRLLAQTYDTNLIPALKNAADSAGALDKESAIRFDTIKSKFQLLKNAFVKGGLTIGDGFLPALGRLTTKITTWVNDNSGKLEQVGKDIGKALDDIDWKEVERGANRVADAAKVILDVVKQIPTEVKLGGAAFLGLDKLSGGLLGAGAGNVVGGAIDAVFKQFVARGASPGNPVWVASATGGVGGKGGPGGGGGLLAALGSVGFLAGISAALGVASQANAAQGTIKGDAFGVTLPGGRPSKDLAVIIALTREQNGTLRDVDRNTLAVYRSNLATEAAVDGSTAAVERMRAGMTDTFVRTHHDSSNKQYAAIERLRGNIGASLSSHKQATIAAGLAAKNAADRTTAATRGVARSVDRKDLSVDVRTQVNVSTSVSVRDLGKTIVRNTRYGVTREIL